MSHESYIVACRHCGTRIISPGPGCAECRPFKPKPWRDPCVFGGAMVGSDPVPDPYAELNAAVSAGRRYRFQQIPGGRWSDWQKPTAGTDTAAMAFMSWTYPASHYEIEPVPVVPPKDLAQRLDVHMHALQLMHYTAGREPTHADLLRDALKAEGVTDPAMVMATLMPSEWSIRYDYAPALALGFEVLVPRGHDKPDADGICAALALGKARLQIVRVP